MIQSKKATTSSRTMATTYPARASHSGKALLRTPRVDMVRRNTAAARVPYPNMRV